MGGTQTPFQKGFRVFWPDLQVEATAPAPHFVQRKAEARDEDGPTQLASSCKYVHLYGTEGPGPQFLNTRLISAKSSSQGQTTGGLPKVSGIPHTLRPPDASRVIYCKHEVVVHSVVTGPGCPTASPG